VTRNNASKAWEKGVIFDVFVTYIELIITLFDVGLSFLTSMQSLLLTSFTLFVISRLELVPMIKAGEFVDYFFHMGSVITCSIALIGMFIDFSQIYLPLFIVGFIFAILIQYYSIWWISLIPKLFSVPLQGLSEWNIKAKKVIKFTTLIGCSFLLILVLFIR
jgi:hypothetical protein